MKIRGFTSSDSPNLEKDMKQALLYHSIVKVEEVDGQTGRLILDDGTRLIVMWRLWQWVVLLNQAQHL